MQNVPAPAASRAPEQTFRLGARPAWIPESPVRHDVPAGKENHLTVLLHEQRSAPAEGLFWMRRVVRLETREAVQPGSQVVLDWDPETEDLVVQSVRIWRDGTARDCARRERFLLRQRESELAQGLVTGQMSALLLLEDVRPGDAVEIEFCRLQTREFPGALFDGSFTVEFPLATADWLYSVRLPPGRSLFWRGFRTDAEPEITDAAPGTEWTWRGLDCARITEEAGVPPWIFPWAWVQVSEYQDWRDVAACISGAWREHAPGPDVAAKAGAIAAAFPDPEAQIVEAIRFVQDDVRYLGLSIGHGRLIPSAPDKVINRLFGDCKDKSLLLCALLENLGVAAEPVLVHSRAGRSLPNRLPALEAFDHVIVRIAREDRHFWVDPTIAGQGGGLRKRSVPDYFCGLVVHGDTAALTDLPHPGPDGAGIRVTEHFFLSQSGGRSRLDWTIEASGTYADSLRSWIRLNGSDKFTQTQLEEHQRNLPHLRRLDPAEIVDDLAENQFRVSGSFAMHDWGDTLKSRTNPFSAAPRWVLRHLFKPKAEADRKLACILEYPLRVHHEIHVHTKRPPSITVAKRRVHTDWFEYDARLDRNQGVVTFSATYRTLRDHLLPREMPEFSRQVERFEEFTGFSLQIPWFGPMRVPDPGEEAVRSGKPLSQSKPEDSPLREEFEEPSPDRMRRKVASAGPAPEWDKPRPGQHSRSRRRSGGSRDSPGGLDARALWVILLILIAILKVVFGYMMRH